MSQLMRKGNNTRLSSVIEISCIFLLLSQVTSFIGPFRELCPRQTSLSGSVSEFNEDFYDALNLSRSASREEIRSAFRSKARILHPDRFVEELRFDPGSMSTSEVREFLTEQRVSYIGVFERSELNKLAREARNSNNALPKSLQKRREQVTDKFSLLNLAYTTLYDTKSRSIYDLSGEWGLGKKEASERSRTTGNGSSDARRQQERTNNMQNEVRRQRERTEAAQRSAGQRRQQEESERAARQEQDRRNAATRSRWQEEADQRENAQRQRKRWDQENVSEVERQRERVEAFQQKANQRKKQLQEESVLEEQRAQARTAAIQRNAARERDDRERAEAAKRTVAQQQAYEIGLRQQAGKKAKETKLKKEKNKKIQRETEERRRERKRESLERSRQANPWKEFLSKSVFGSLWD